MLGVGSELRSDDAAGLLAARRLARRLRGREDVLVLEGGTAPENLTGPILRFNPSHVVIIDCAEIDSPPGGIRLIRAGEIGGFSSCTHSLPMSVILGYLAAACACETLILGIRPRRLDFGGRPSGEIRRASRIAARDLARAIESRTIP